MDPFQYVVSYRVKDEDQDLAYYRDAKIETLYKMIEFVDKEEATPEILNLLFDSIFITNFYTDVELDLLPTQQLLLINHLEAEFLFAANEIKEYHRIRSGTAN